MSIVSHTQQYSLPFGKTQQVKVNSFDKVDQVADRINRKIQKMDQLHMEDTFQRRDGQKQPPSPKYLEESQKIGHSIGDDMESVKREAYNEALAKTGNKDYAKEQSLQASNELLKALNKKMLPDASAEVLEEMDKAQAKSMDAGTKAYQKALIERPDDKNYAYEQRAKTVFQVGLDELHASPKYSAYEKDLESQRTQSENKK